jgi:hypothetical protein
MIFKGVDEIFRWKNLTFTDEIWLCQQQLLFCKNKSDEVAPKTTGTLREGW